MSQATSNGVFNQAVNELLEELKKTQATPDVGSAQGPNEAFMGAMQQAQHTGVLHTEVSATIAAHHTHSGSVLAQAKVAKMEPTTKSIGSTERAEDSALVRVIRDLVHGQDEMAKVMDRALSGEMLGTVDIVQMQATIYRYTQELDLSSKVVDNASKSVKQTLNTQV